MTETVAVAAVSAVRARVAAVAAVTNTREQTENRTIEAPITRFSVCSRKGVVRA